MEAIFHFYERLLLLMRGCQMEADCFGKRMITCLPVYNLNSVALISKRNETILQI